MTLPRVLVVDDDAALREALCETLDGAGYRVSGHLDGSDALSELGRCEDVDLILTDVQMQPMDGLSLLGRVHKQFPGVAVLLMTAYASVEHAVAAVKAGAEDYLVKPFDRDELLGKVANLIDVCRAPLQSGTVVADARQRELFELATRVAATEATVLISGESGTGKEVLARYVHEHSPRTDGPFVAINCAAIPENMLEAVLFGYERGAFTGAVRATPGKFEQAQQGTLLLDEISEMDLGLQAKLLRVLQEREVERIGGSRMIELDVRVLATTNRRLREEVAAGRFREDLFYRLNVFPLHLLPLRERPGDLQPLAESLLARHSRGAAKLRDTALAKLRAHAWPGNVRELDNVLQRAVILAPDGKIDAQAIQFEHAAADETESAELDLSSSLRSQEHRRIVEVLRETVGNRKCAAQKLGISPRTLRYKLAQMRDAGLAIPRRDGSLS
ncbi:MAG: sigma-54 dependent transcriptional regulator [Gammaproteobacteria bacterium]|nr:sigma-54 dependent transcriptional regulator [Gammaproteobacteria bacterium]